MWGLFSNPYSGGGKGKQLKSQVIQILHSRNQEFYDYSGPERETAANNLRSLRKDELQGLIVIGGDGTINLAIQSLAKTNVPLAVIPAGTGNDFARTLGLNLKDPIKNLDACFDSLPTSIDLGVVRNRYFVQILSTGFDSLVNERANSLPIIKGRMKYNFAIVFELLKFRPKSYRFEVDGVGFETKAMLIAVANGNCYGGGMLISPKSDPQDGLLDVMIVGPVSKLEFIKVFPKVYRGAHTSHPAVKFLSGKRIEIESEAIAYADGERIGDLPVTAEIVEGGLKVWRK
ncbi:MAG: YegS/Rv2252/BmrU family lipid kinase [Candidatus Nanopelagicaceae bacterium]|nr:YegS/Rv2252/BmrU family lipid kinase [Candidatus Nanopelagicaceae bacterium]